MRTRRISGRSGILGLNRSDGGANGAGSTAEVNHDIPVACVRGRQANGRSLSKATVIPKPLAPPVITKVGVIHQLNVRLLVDGNLHNIPGRKVKVVMEKLH